MKKELFNKLMDSVREGGAILRNEVEASRKFVSDIPNIKHSGSKTSGYNKRYDTTELLKKMNNLPCNIDNVRKNGVYFHSLSDWLSHICLCLADGLNQLGIPVFSNIEVQVMPSFKLGNLHEAAEIPPPCVSERVEKSIKAIYHLPHRPHHLCCLRNFHRQILFRPHLRHRLNRFPPLHFPDYRPTAIPKSAY